MLNSAKISHCDLLPRNILWKNSKDGLDLKIIDFDYSCFFGRPVFPSLTKSIYEERDFRYPFYWEYHRGNRCIRGRKEHNLFFLEAIKSFFTRKYSSFTDFMNEHSESIYMQVEQ